MAKRTGVAVSLWMSRSERRDYRDLCALANKAQGSGPVLSGSHIVRTLLRAYREGVDIPGLPKIEIVGTADAVKSV